jgi:hypothetical protein
MKRSFLLLLFLVVQGRIAKGQTCPPGPPQSRYDGTTVGIPLAGGGRQYSFEYAQIGGFDCWEHLRTWFPAYLNSSTSISPNRVIVDMAYAVKGTATFHNIDVPSNGNYNLTIGEWSSNKPCTSRSLTASRITTAQAFLSPSTRERIPSRCSM